MTRHYSPRNFLRQAPNELLARYFRERDLLSEINVTELDETEVDPVFEALEGLPAERRTQVDSDFAIVDLLADEDGLRTILEEGRFHGEDLEPVFAPMGGFYDKALWTFLERLAYVEVAERFREADRLPGNYWARRRQGVPMVQPRDDEAASNELAQALGAYFRVQEGRGHACVVDVYRRGERFYFFAYPEDYGRTQIEFDGGKLERRPHRPAFEVIFVYSPDEAALDIFFRGQRKCVGDLQKIFGQVALATELRVLSKDDRVYELNRFRHPDLRFVYDPASGIQDVRIKLLRLSILGGGTKRITLEADPSRDKDAVYDLLDDLFDTRGEQRSEGGPRLPLALANVTRVGIEATFTRDGRRGRSTKTFFISYPNGCTLKHEGRDGVLRQMLIDSRIEPVALSSAESG